MLEFELSCDQCCAVTLVAAVALGCSYEAGGLVVLEVEDAGLEVWSLVGLYGTFQDQGTTCVSRQSDANFFISKRNETLNFFAPLRMMAGPIYHAKKPA